MNRRQLAVGVTATGAGLLVFATLAITGVLRHPQRAIEHTQPGEFLAIGGGFLLVTVGILVTVLACIDLPDPDR